jgi:biopolymer transport protein ExbD
MKFRRQGVVYGFLYEEEPTVNLVPLVDVVLLLLIFLSVTTTFIVAPGIEVHLPVSDSQEIRRQMAEIGVAVTPEGRIFVDGIEVPLENLDATFKAKVGHDGNIALIIQADRMTPHGMVVEIMDAAKRAGIPRLAIATQPRTQEKPKP